MSRIALIDQSTANDEQRALLDAVEGQLGMVPNFLKVFANSPAAPRAFLGLYGIAGEGRLEAPTRERIAHACQYCVSAHTAMGSQTGLSEAEIAAARRGTSDDPKAAAAVTFARTVMEKRGEVSNADLMAVRTAGLDDAEVVEVITHVGMNFLTNVLGKASQVEIDFPAVELHLVS